MHIHALASSTRGRNAITFSIFLVISTAFWFILALNNEAQHEFVIPIEINEVPSNITILSSAPQSISVSVKDKGTSLLRHEWGNLPKLSLDYNDFQNDGKRINLNSAQLGGMLRSYFGQHAIISDLKPDSISLAITNHPGVTKIVKLNADITSSPQHIISGPVKIIPDSVKLYSQTNISRSLTVMTDSVIMAGLTDTTYVEVDLQVPEGYRVIPSRVNLMIPIEPLISKTKQIPVEVLNVPKGIRIVTFPSFVDLTYNLPMSLYNRDNFAIKAFANFDENKKRLPLSLSTLPDIYRNAYLSVDSVEFVVEH